MAKHFIVFLLFSKEGDYLFSKSYKPIIDSSVSEIAPKKNTADIKKNIPDIITPKHDTTEKISIVIQSPKR
ncbi:MAG: hypothetical protein WDM71_10125 [Ferruginibacter sp.]